ncbi:MAG: MbnP family protein [Roseibacillus sp.]
MIFRILAAYFLLSSALSALNLQVDFRWHDKPLSIPTSGLITPSGEKIDITRLDLLLNQPHLTLQSGRSITASQWHAYIHGKKPEVMRLPHLAEDSIKEFTLHLGPSPEINNADSNQYPSGHALNPLHNNLHWSPQSGYIFFAIEGQLPNDELAFAYHYGNNENRLALNFEGPFDPNGFYQLTLHLERLFPAPFRIADRTSTHSRPEDPLVPHFKKTLQQAFTLTPIATEKKAPNTQVATADQVGTPYPFTMPRNFPHPKLPTDYPLTKERVRLGRELFFETALSKNTATSCASCHPSQNAFVDNTAKSFGFLGEKTKRHSMPLLNLAWKTTPFFWDGRSPSLRDQILKPIEDPLEMGEELPNVIQKLEKISYYPRLFESAFGDREITSERLAIAIEQFLLSLTSFDSKFDRAAKGKAELTEQEKRGFELFMTENDPRLGLRGADCFHCHSGAFFTNHRFHNNGLPPANEDLGREHTTGKRNDRFKFSTPSLRNIAITSPYMHDGRFDTLEEVVQFYSSQIHRSPTLDPNIAKHPGNGLDLDKEEQAALVAFLKTLSDPRFQR